MLSTKLGPNVLPNQLRRDQAIIRPNLDEVERLQIQVAEIIVNRRRELRGCKGGMPRFILSASSSHFSHDHEILRVRIQRFFDDPVGHVRAVKITGIDMIDAGRNGFAKDRERRGWIAWGSPNTGTGQLHRAIP